ncbi:MAG TPA: ribosome biogenesis GTP-binding protein YihA/YsxC [Burkholderiales bacterium]|nr:ribosome biogenesis GTP-binding protein YihA/YsxC [Burkholderiales bacterium]
MSLLQHVVFFTSVADWRDLPMPEGEEIAFAGRSNAGKSSALNALAKRKRLAFISKSPGRTQQINFFSMGNGRYLVDLPGYGYAKVPGTMRQHWETLISNYLQTRKNLRGLVLIMDARNPITALDKQMLDWFLPTGKPVHILLSKADKLNKQQANNTLHHVTETLSLCYPQCTVQLFSSVSKLGLEEAEAAITAWFGPSLVAVSKIKNPRLKGSKPGVKRLK